MAPNRWAQGGDRPAAEIWNSLPIYSYQGHVFVMKRAKSGGVRSQTRFDIDTKEQIFNSRFNKANLNLRSFGCWRRHLMMWRAFMKHICQDRWPVPRSRVRQSSDTTHYRKWKSDVICQRWQWNMLDKRILLWDPASAVILNWNYK